MKKICVLLVAISFLQTAFSQESLIRGTIDKMFQGLYTADTALLRTCFIPGAKFMTYSFDSRGNPRAKGDDLNEFLRKIALAGAADMEERLTQWQCLIDEGIASVWTPYEFYFEKKFSHCGVNSFQLMNVQGEWKITMITDTRKKAPCYSEKGITEKIDSLINAWHFDAATANEDGFFGKMTEDAIYIGTDAGERWLRDELRAWSAKYFDRESAWDFTPLSREVTVGPGGQIAWFDELLDTWMGTCRSTGIVEWKDGSWKIRHYQLSIAVPNDKIEGYRSLIGK